MTTTTNQKIAALYVACFERAPDKEGLDFWNQVATDSGLSDLGLMELIAEGFANHPTFLATYGNLGNVAFVEQIYLNVGGRPADAAGLNYWVSLIEGGMSRSDMVANYVYGLLEITEDQLDALVTAGTITPAEKEDALYRQANLTNKVDVGLVYVDAMGDGSNLSPSTDPLDPVSLAADPAYQAAQAIIAGVNGDPASMAEELAFLAGNPTIDGILNEFGSPTPGQNLNLTPNVDNINITTSGTKDIVTGIVDTVPPPFGQSTYTVGDSIQGNGFTELKLLVTNGFGVAQLAAVSNVSDVDVIFSSPAGGNLLLDGLLWSNVGAVNLAQSSAIGPDVTLYVPNLPVGADMSIGSNAAGFLSADYTNGIYAWMYSDRGSAVSFIDGNVVGIADAGGSASFSLSAQANGIDVSVGSISITAPGNDGDNSYVGIYNSVDKPGDINVGDVTQTGFSSAQLYVSKTDATSDAAPSDITVGNITHNVRNSSTIYVNQTDGDGETGNVTVGNVMVTVGKNGSGYAEISNTGYNSIGAITVGDVMVSLGAGATHEFYINNSADEDSAGDDVSSGDVTVGSLTYSLGVSASASFTLYNSVSSSLGAAMVGDVSVGDMMVTLGQDAYFYGYLNADADAVTGSMASVGDFTVGDITIAGAATSSFTMYATASATNSNGPGASVGQFTVGDINVDMGVYSDGYMEFSAYAYGTDDSKVNIAGLSMGDINIAIRDSADMTLYQYAEAYGGIGDMSYGDINVRADVNADVSLYFSASASTDIGDVTVGDILLDGAGVNATAYANFYYYAYEDIGDVTFGDVTTVAGADSAYAGITVSVSATDGDIGNVTLGDLNLAAAANADASQYYYFTADDGAIGNVSVGNVNSNAIGKSAYAYMSINAYASDGDLGTVSVGNVGALGSGENAFGGAYGYFYAEDDVGNVTLGNLAAQAKGKNAYSYVSITVSADTGSVGDVTVGNLSAKGTGENAYGYVSVDVYGDEGVGNVTIGNATINSSGNGADAYVYVYVTADTGGGSDIGDIVAGDVALTVKGTNAYGWYGLTASSVDDIGSMTVGNLDLSVGTAAKKAGAYLEVDIYMSASDDAGDMTVGNITLTGSTVRAAGDVTMAYVADVDIVNDDAALTVGNITVKGGDGLSDNFANLNTWLYLYGDTGVTIGSVDYSGYGAAATIDVSGYKGAPTIKGGAKADAITDNKGTNAMTGGGGADTFTIVETNANLTMATMDKITDFSQSGGDTIDLNFVVIPGVAGNYTEQAGLADFAAFLAAAGAANKQVFVGQITGENGVAIAFDFDNDGTVDTAMQLVGVGLNDIDHLAFS